MPSNSSSTIDGGGVTFPVIDQARCDLCDGCNSVCPTNAIFVDERRWILDPGACIGCELCAIFCPSDALAMAGAAPGAGRG